MLYKFYEWSVYVTHAMSFGLTVIESGDARTGCNNTTSVFLTGIWSF